MPVDWVPPSPAFFVSVADKGVTGAKSVSVASKGVAGGQLRLISAKTRSSSASVHSRDLMRRRTRLKRQTPRSVGAPRNTSFRFAGCIIQEIVDLSIGWHVLDRRNLWKTWEGNGIAIVGAERSIRERRVCRRSLVPVASGTLPSRNTYEDGVSR